MIPSILLRDGCFPEQLSATLAGQTYQEAPKLLRWERIGPGQGVGQTVVYTDMCLTEAILDHAARKIAWLIEPPSINPKSYAFVAKNRQHFDEVLTHQKAFADQIGGRYYPFGGTRIPAKQRVIGQKTENVCLIASEKRISLGHTLRHEVARRYNKYIDVYGPSYSGWHVHHADILPRYRYAVVIENEQSSDWFTEKLIDCLLTGVIPFYWGSPDAPKRFVSSGIVTWQHIDQLGSMLKVATPETYERLQMYVSANHYLAQQYVCAEDWMMSAYPEVFR